MSIIIGADIAPVASNIDLYINCQLDTLLGAELIDILQSADCRVCNLEVPLTDNEKPISKYGPNLIAPTTCINGLKAMNLNVLTLANNHIMDQDTSGLVSTIQLLKEVGISHVGAGVNIYNAQKPLYQKIGERRYGIYACAEHEFSIATNNNPGANPFDPMESFDHIEQMKRQCDYIIVLYHGGKEHYRYPSPNLQKICRKMVENGADLVICQHSHCIGCKEDYLNGTIVYGQGNFIFPSQNNEYWNTSILILLDDQDNISYIPLKRTDRGVRLAVGDEKERIMDDFYRRSEEIQEDGFIDKRYAAFASENIDDYIRYFSESRNSVIYRGMNFLSRNKIRKWVIRRYFQRRRMGLINYIECEAHRELLIEGLKIKKQ